MYSKRITCEIESSQIDDVNGFDNTLVTPFKERLEANEYSIDDLELVGRPGSGMTYWSFSEEHIRVYSPLRRAETICVSGSGDDE